jgi:beta-1,4-mannosyltransferase
VNRPSPLRSHDPIDRDAPIRVLALPGPTGASTNPYITSLYRATERFGVNAEDLSIGRLLNRRAPDVVHLHWVDALLNRRDPTAIVKLTGLLVLLRLARIRGVRVVWTAHNHRSHERPRPRVERWFWRRLERAVDATISLTEAGADELRQLYPRLGERPRAVIPHGHYRDSYPATMSSSEARRHFGLGDSSFVFGFFGAVRPYKQVPELIRAFRALPGPECRLVVAGAASGSLSHSVAAAAAGDDRILLQLRFVPTGLVQAYLLSADLMVLPFADLTNSGSAVLALSFGCPVLVPRLPALLELADQVGDEWVRFYDEPLSPVVLEHAREWTTRTRPTSGPDLSVLDWDVLGRATARFLRRVVAC